MAGAVTGIGCRAKGVDLRMTVKLNLNVSPVTLGVFLVRNVPYKKKALSGIFLTEIGTREPDEELELSTAFSPFPGIMAAVGSS